MLRWRWPRGWQRWRTIPTIAAIASVARVAGAHDQWLETREAPTREATDREVRLFVGEGLAPDEEKVFERAKFARFAVRSANGAIDLLPLAAEGRAPLVTIAGLGPGAFLIDAERRVVRITLAPATFESYLAEEGLTAALAERRARGETSLPGRERYTRHLKVLVRTAARADDAPLAATALGHKLEILRGPLPTTRGAPFEVRVRFEGRPLTNAQIESHWRGPDGIVSQRAQTDAAGTAQFRFEGAGTTSITLVHMRRCVDAQKRPCADADWESAWASFVWISPTAGDSA